MLGARVLAASAACAVLIAAGCNQSTQPPGVGGLFPAFSLVDVNPYSATSGQNLTQTALVGPAALVYFGWAT